MEMEYPTSTGDYGEAESLAKAGALDALTGLYPDIDVMTSEELKEYSTWQGMIETAPVEAFDITAYMSETERKTHSEGTSDETSMPSAEEIARDSVLKILCPDGDCSEFTLASIRMATMENSYSLPRENPGGPCYNIDDLGDVKDCAGVVLGNLLR